MPLTLEQRLADFPTADLDLQAPVHLRWNEHAVPYIEAEHDVDAAYALGLCHAHLRLAQLHLMKRIAQGRVAEMFGPPAVNLDHALRLLDLPGVATRCAATLAADTRAWVEPFVRGLNDYQQRLRRRPPEFRWLALKPEPWTLVDVLTLGRLAGADVNWSSYLGLLRTRAHPGFASLWQRLCAVGGAALAGRAGQAMTQLVRGGSNSVVIAASRSASGAPLMANDPHLGQQLPNFWVLAGVRSPTYHMVGLMPTGLPFVGVGVGPHFAWGGTNMRAASSDLVDVSQLPHAEVHTTYTDIRVRGMGTRRRRIRRTVQGPILNDARVLRVAGGDVALRWVGARTSDEIGAFLGAARARTVEQFRSAFADFGVCAQNILFASRDGHIGHVYAAHLPCRSALPQTSPILSPLQADEAWQQRWDALSLPLTVDPAAGFRVSANDRPQFDRAPLGFFFSEGDRAARLAELAAGERLSLADLIALQNDTRVPGAARLAASLALRLERADADAEVVAALRDWDGDYAADAGTPVLFESLLHALASGLRPQRALHRAVDLDDEWGRHTRLLIDDLDALPSASLNPLLRRAAQRALAARRRYPRWGDMHRLRVGHLLSLIPMFGRGLVVAEWGAGGTRESPMKNSHGLVAGRHRVQYGAQARHVSDLADPDANHFVLLGGNDGWIGSDNYADQLGRWRNRTYVHMPLRAAGVESAFSRLTLLRPVAAATSDAPHKSQRAPVAMPSATQPQTSG